MHFCRMFYDSSEKLSNAERAKVTEAKKKFCTLKFLVPDFVKARFLPPEKISVFRNGERYGKIS